MSTQSNQLNSRYAGMHAKGIETLISDPYESSPGVPERVAKNCIVACSLGPMDTVYSGLTESFREFGFIDPLAGVDYPTHITIKQGSPGSLGLISQFHPGDTAELLGLEFVFDNLVVTGKEILLCSSMVSDEVYKARDKFSVAMESCGMTPIPIGILHSTTGRVTGSPNLEARRRLAACADDWRTHLLKNPIRMHVQEVFVGSVGELLNL
mgnify:CR=1 FL=1